MNVIVSILIMIGFGLATDDVIEKTIQNDVVVSEAEYRIP
jgi:hypothetical protein